MYKTDLEKANNRYSLLARYGLQYICQKALLELREKLSVSGFEAVASLYSRVYEDTELHENFMAESLLEGDNLSYYLSVHL